LRIYVALGRYDLPRSIETIGDPLVIEDDDGSRWVLTGHSGDRFPFPRGREDELHEIRGLEQLPPGEFGIDLVGVAEIARRAQVSSDSVQRWHSGDHDFPKVLADLAAGPVWSWQAIERWLAVARPGGRPPARPESALDERARWAARIREGDAVSVHGRPRCVLGIRRRGPLAPYFRFEEGGVWFSYMRPELAPASAVAKDA
jgi:hypothetical protein